VFVSQTNIPLASMSIIKQVIQHLESIAPSVYQESYDNAGLLTGNPDWPVSGVLCCLDSTEAVVEEAVQKGCNLIVAHHPIIFSGLKRLTGRTYVERTIMAAIKNDVAIYAIHTNLDNVYHQGVNAKIASVIGLNDTQILAPKSILRRATLSGTRQGSEEQLRAAGAVEVVYVSDTVCEVLFPVAVRGRLEEEIRRSGAMLSGIHTVEDAHRQTGSGMIGTLDKPLPEQDFLLHLKKVMRAGVVRHTALREREVQRVAVCGGSGGFLLGQAIAQGADVFVTADYKYHEFFDADGRIVIADIGHFESEQFTIDLLHEIISEKFSTFAAYCAKARTNPVFYL
jgi:dinuclear metal center YbgI/SA1388 family protein